MPFVTDPVNYSLFSITISVIFLSVRGVGLHSKGDEELQVLRCPQVLQSWIRSHSVPPEDPSEQFRLQGRCATVAEEYEGVSPPMGRLR